MTVSSDIKVQQELSDIDKKIAGLLILSFRTNYNSAQAKIKNDTIVKKVTERGYKFSGAKLRNLLGFIRHHHLARPGFIVSDNQGYWYTEDHDELREFWESQRGRVLEIMKNVHPLYEMLKIDPNQIWMDAQDMEQPPAPVLNTTDRSIQ